MDKIKKHLAYFHQCPVEASDEEVDNWRIIMEDFARDIENFYRYYGRHAYDIKVRGYSMRGESDCRPPIYAKNAIDKYVAEYGLDGFEPNYWHVHGGSNGMCGQATLGGNRGVTYLLYTCGSRTGIHEWGHNLNLSHASAPGTNGNLDEYGDTTAIMGNKGSSGMKGMNAPHLLQLGVETFRETLLVERTQQVLLAPVELNQHALHDTEYQTAILRKPNDSTMYYASLRKTRGCPYPAGQRDESTLFIHSQYRDRQTVLINELRPGYEYTLPNGMRVKYLEYDNETARVNFYVNADDPEPGDIPMPGGFPAMLDTMSVAEGHNGAWYNPDFDGQGISVTLRDNRMAFYFYTYDQHKNYRRYYFGAADVVEDQPVEFTLYTTDKGSFNDPTTAVEIEVGKATLGFFDGKHGIFAYNTKEHGRQAMEIIPVALSDSNKSGVYYQPSRNGEGFFIQVFEQYGRCAVFWYSYGAADAGNPYSISRQRWYSCEGAMNANGKYVLDVLEPLDGKWMAFDKPELAVVGNALVDISEDGQSATFTYEIATNGATGSGTFNLIKLK